MTTREKQVVSAYTGYLMCTVAELNSYIQEVLGKCVFTHELAREDIWNQLHEKTKADFIAICAGTFTKNNEKEGH